MLTNNDFAAFVASRPVVVIHFDADWDEYRTQVRAKMLKAEQCLHEFAAFAEVDCDVDDDVGKKLGIANVPSVAYFRESTLIALRTGADQDIHELTELLVNRRAVVVETSPSADATHRYSEGS